MPSMNKVILLGHAGKDAEAKYLSTGTLLTEVSLATSKSFKNGDEWESKTQWHTVKMFGEKGERMSDVARGDLLLVEGEIEYRKWTAPDGTNRYSTEINAHSVKIINSKASSASSGSYSSETLNEEDDGIAPSVDEVFGEGDEDEVGNPEDFGI